MYTDPERALGSILELGWWRPKSQMAMEVLCQVLCQVQALWQIRQVLSGYFVRSEDFDSLLMPVHLQVILRLRAMWRGGGDSTWSLLNKVSAEKTDS